MGKITQQIQRILLEAVVSNDVSIRVCTVVAIAEEKLSIQDELIKQLTSMIESYEENERHVKEYLGNFRNS